VCAPHYRYVPAVLADAARSADIALIVLHREVKFVTLTEAVHRRIIADQTAALEARDAVRTLFTGVGQDRRHVAVVGAQLEHDTCGTHLGQLRDEQRQPPGIVGPSRSGGQQQFAAFEQSRDRGSSRRAPHRLRGTGPRCLRPRCAGRGGGRCRAGGVCALGACLRQCGRRATARRRRTAAVHRCSTIRAMSALRAASARTAGT
jgi:hypothetical protein